MTCKYLPINNLVPRLYFFLSVPRKWTLAKPRFVAFLSFSADSEFILLKADWLAIDYEHFAHSQKSDLTRGCIVVADHRLRALTAHAQKNLEHSCC